MKRKLLVIVTSIILAGWICLGAEPFFDLKEMTDATTLDLQVIQDWHVVKGNISTRQKFVSMRVGMVWPGQEYRVPLRFVVPLDKKARGFHLTGGHGWDEIHRDASIGGVNRDLLLGGVGLVYTMVQDLHQLQQKELGDEMYQRFIKTLDTRYSVQYWGWPATLMRSVTAAYNEKDYFDRGKIAVTGGSKNGATPSLAIIHDERMTAVWASVSPLCESPLRLCDQKAWAELETYDQLQFHGKARPHSFLGGTFGPVYNRDALAAGKTWSEIESLAKKLNPGLFISQNLERLKKRDVEMLFHPGTHDFVAFDVPWAGAHYPQIPVYLKANSGHGVKQSHPLAEKKVQNYEAFLLRHFFPDDIGPLLTPPEVTTEIKDGSLCITVKFEADSASENGRVWWIYDRASEGSVNYLRKMIPDENTLAMKTGPEKDSWTADIPLKDGACTIDFFSNHAKTLRYKEQSLSTYISCPYTRIKLK